jgi:hypothetical protein
LLNNPLGLLDRATRSVGERDQQGVPDQLQRMIEGRLSAEQRENVRVLG